jgi:hypothetical protein
MRMNRSGRMLVVPAAVLALGLAGAAWAHGGRGRGFFGGDGEMGGRHGGCGGGVVQRLVFPCRAGCFDAAKSCFETAKTTALSCVSGSCGTQVTAAQTACQADRRSTGCETALDALKTCAQSCTDAAETATSSCRTTAKSCVTACGNS